MTKKYNIGIFGGSQGVGKHCILQALAQGHTVTALGRSAKKFEDVKSENFTLVEGDVMEADKVDRVV